MKINRLFGIAFIFSILLFSCRFNDTNNVESNENSVPTIKLSVNQEISRTAWPQMNVNMITRYSLTGSLLDADGQTITSVSKVWNSTDTASAYTLMTQDEIAVSAGNWNFTLTALVKNGDLTLVSYIGTRQIEITGGQNILSFNLILQGVDVSEQAGSGDLTIKLNFGAANTTKKIKAYLMTQENDVRTQVEGSALIIQTRDANSDGFVDVTTAGSPYLYSKTGLPAGAYIAQFDFYGDEQMNLLLGSYLEAVNINSLGAVSTITVNRLDSSYNIAYYEYVLGQTSPSPVLISSDADTTNNNPLAYSRHSEFNFAAPVKANHTFWKWILIAQDDSTINTNSLPVSGLAKNSIGNRSYCAVFIPDEEAAQIDSIAFSGRAKVGHTITANAKVGTENFAGTVEKIVWLAVDSENDEESVIKTVTENCASTDSYTVEPAYAEKTITVKFVQKYHIQKSGNIINSVRLTEGSLDYAVEGSSESILKGTLNADDVSVNYSPVTVIGQAITNSFAISAGSVKDANTSSWIYDEDDVTLTYVGNDRAPIESAEGAYSVKFAVAGYDDLTVNKTAFVNVKAEAPVVSGALVANPARITYGKIAFAKAGESLYEDERATDWEYSTDAGSTWTDVVLTGENAEITKPAALHVRTKVIGSAGQAGYVAASEKVAVPIDNDTNVGTKVVIGSVTVASNGTDGAVEMGDTLTATAVSAIEGQTIKIGANIGTITWVWNAAGTAIYTEENTTSLTSTYQLANVGNCYDKAITVEAQYHYLAAGEASLIAGEKNITKDKSAGTVGEGELTDNDFTLSYNSGNTVLQGTTLSSSSLSYVSGNMTNKLNAEIITGISGVVFTFSPDKAPASSGTITVSAKVNGYKAKSFTVPISIKKSQPVAASIMNSNTAAIELGKINFKEGPYTLSSLEFCYEDDYNSSDADQSEWQTVTSQAIFNKNGERFNPTAGEKIYIRFKQIAATETSGVTLASDVTEITITSAFIGVRSMSVVSIVVDDNSSQMNLTVDGYTLTASGFKNGATCTWYIDDVQVDETSSSFTLPSTVTSRTGNYAIRVESVNDFGETISVTAVVTVSNN